jgi:hypothetical protein
VLRQLAEAARQRSDPLRLEHFGNAMHVVEDFYAHSNFVELAVLDRGGRATPWPGGTPGPATRSGTSAVGSA